MAAVSQATDPHRSSVPWRSNQLLTLPRSPRATGTLDLEEFTSMATSDEQKVSSVAA